MTGGRMQTTLRLRIWLAGTILDLLARRPWPQRWTRFELWLVRVRATASRRYLFGD